MSEFFGSFGNVLTTENELLTNIISAPTVLIELWIGFLVFTSILNIKYTKKQKILYILSLSLSSLISEFFIPAPFNVFINYILMFMAAKLLLKTNIIQTILSVFIPSAIYALVVVLILNPILKIFGINSIDLNNIPIFTLIYQLLLYGLTFILYHIMRYFKLNFIALDNITKRNKQIIVINLLLGIITIFSQCILLNYYINILPIFITVLNFILLFAYFCISFYSLTRIIKLQITTQNLESAENYNNTLNYLYDNVKAFHHDFDNMLFIIGGFIDNNDIQGLKKYYKNLEKDGERVNNIALLNPKIINNSGIYNLLMSKYKKAHDLNVEIKLDYFFDFERLKMPIYEFSRILGILLDNAIEASSESKVKQVKIMFRDSSNNHTQIVSIENTYINQYIDTVKIFQKGNTNKKNHTGMGLWEVTQILKRNNNVVLKTSKDDNYFKQNLEIYY